MRDRVGQEGEERIVQTQDAPSFEGRPAQGAEEQIESRGQDARMEERGQDRQG